MNEHLAPASVLVCLGEPQHCAKCAASREQRLFELRRETDSLDQLRHRHLQERVEQREEASHEAGSTLAPSPERLHQQFGKSRADHRQLDELVARAAGVRRQRRDEQQRHPAVKRRAPQQTNAVADRRDSRLSCPRGVHDPQQTIREAKIDLENLFELRVRALGIPQQVEQADDVGLLERNVAAADSLGRAKKYP